MNPNPQTLSAISAALQQWTDAQTHLSQAIKSYVTAATLLESICTSFWINSTPGVLNTIEDNLRIMEREEFSLHRTQMALKMKKKVLASPVCSLPSELLAHIFTIAVNSSNTSGEYLKHKLSWVCSRWRQVALEFCPIYVQSCFDFGIDNTLEDKRPRAIITLKNERDRYLFVPVDRQPDVGDAPYAQMALDKLAPYMKRLDSIRLNADVEQLRPLLNSWLKEEAPRSIASLCLSSNWAAPVFPETSSHLSERLNLFLRHVERLTISSLGLAWSSIVFDKLDYISLSDLPAFCCPTLEQLSRMLSTCHSLRSIHLEHITIPDSRNAAAPEPVEFKRLRTLSIRYTDVSGVLSIVAPGHDMLDLDLRGIIDDANVLKSLCSFFGRANISELTLTLLEPRSDQTLARLLLSAISTLHSLRRLMLRDMNLYESELAALTHHTIALVQHNQALPSASVVATGGLGQLKFLYLWDCTIRTTPTAFRDAVYTITRHSLVLRRCKYLPVVQEGDGATEVLSPIDTMSDFGVQLRELLSGRRNLVLV